MLNKYYPEAMFIDLLSPDVFRKFSAKPERLNEVVEGNPGVKRFIIDEVQKVPELLDAVHQIIEQNKSIKFILTGSSAREIETFGG